MVKHDRASPDIISTIFWPAVAKTCHRRAATTMSFPAMEHIGLDRLARTGLVIRDGVSNCGAGSFGAVSRHRVCRRRTSSSRSRWRRATTNRRRLFAGRQQPRADYRADDPAPQLAHAVSDDQFQYGRAGSALCDSLAGKLIVVPLDDGKSSLQPGQKISKMMSGDAPVVLHHMGSEIQCGIRSLTTTPTGA